MIKLSCFKKWLIVTVTQLKCLIRNLNNYLLAFIAQPMTVDFLKSISLIRESHEYLKHLHSRYYTLWWMYVNKKRRQDAYSRYYFSFTDDYVLKKIIKYLLAKTLVSWNFYVLVWSYQCFNLVLLFQIHGTTHLLNFVLPRFRNMHQMWLYFKSNAL